MNIIMISDIHANYEALTALRPYIEAADKVVCLGDSIGYYCQVNEVLDYLRELNPICILGNHDVFLLKGCPSNLSPEVKFGIEFADSVITAINREWLMNLPIMWSGFMDQLAFLLVHGSPWNPFSDYLYADNPKLLELDAFNYDVIAFGQTHRGLLQTAKKPFLINPGSVGQSRDRKTLACAVRIHTDDMTFQIIESEYNPSLAIDLLKSHQPESKALRYLTA